MSNVHLSIDVGTNLAVAVWSAKDWDRVVDPVAVWSNSTVRVPKQQDGFATGDIRTYVAKLCQSQYFLKTWLNSRGYRVLTVFYEQPQYFESANASARRGDLAKLCMAAGSMVALFEKNETGYPVIEPVAIYNWKGQVSKQVTQNRIKKRLPKADEYCTSEHIWDAVGIGLYVKGQFG